jgi:hypothetical protein
MIFMRLQKRTGGLLQAVDCLAERSARLPVALWNSGTLSERMNILVLIPAV